MSSRCIFLEDSLQAAAACQGQLIPHPPALLKGVGSAAMATGHASDVSSQTPRAMELGKACKKVFSSIDEKFASLSISIHPFEF